MTWSGSSHHLFTALRERAVLSGAVDGSAPRYMDVVAKALAIHPRRARWVERYEFSRISRAARSKAGARRAAEVDLDPDVLFQVGGWYDFSRERAPRPKLRCSYHDSNLAQFLRLSEFVADPGARHITRTLRSERAVYDQIDLILTMSDWLRRSFVEDFGQDPDKVVTVGAGANLDSLPVPRPARRFEPPHFLMVGIEFERKGGRDLLAAFEVVRARVPEATLSIVGPEPRAKGDPGVRWLGRIRRDTADGDAALKQVYEEATAFVMPSRYEPFGVAFLEAMAHELPCIGARACAMPEIIEDEVSGHIVSVGDPEELSAAMLDLALDPERARAMGKAGRERMTERFTWDAVADRMVRTMSSRLDGRGG